MAGLGATLYGASKAAIEAALRHIAAEVGSSGVTLNSLALGMMENLDGVVGAGIAPVFDEMWEDVTVGRFGSGDDVGMACAWLCSDAGGFVTGQTIHLNGGAFSGR